MVYHRDQSHFERSQWRRAFLWPLWLLQVVFLLGLMGIFSYRLSETVRTFEKSDKQGQIPMVLIVWECTNVGLSLLSLVLNTIEISKLVSETLTPFLMLCTHVIKFTCACAILALDVVVYTQRSEGNWSMIGLAIDCALLICTIIPGVYSIITFRRLLKYDDYHHPHNVKHFGFSNNELESAAATSEMRLNPSPAPPETHLSTEYLSVSYPAKAPSRSPSEISFTPSLASSRRTSTASLHTLGQIGRRESYSHKRDTSFDDYVSRRASVSLKEDIDRAMGTEFGWTSPDRSDSVVNTGVVMAARGRLRGDSRTKSWGSGLGMVAVPDRIVEDEEGEHHSQRSASGSSAEQQTQRSGSGSSGDHQSANSDEYRRSLMGHQVATRVEYRRSVATLHQTTPGDEHRRSVTTLHQTTEDDEYRRSLIGHQRDMSDGSDGSDQGTLPGLEMSDKSRRRES